MKKILLLVVTLFTIVSCSKSGDEPQNLGDLQTMELNFARTSLVNSKTVESQMNTVPPTISSAYVLFKSGSTVLRRYDFTIDDLSAINTGAAYSQTVKIENVPSSVNEVEVYANGAVDIANVNNNQMSGTAVPMYGVTNAITDGGVNADGHTLKICTVVLNPALCRVEVVGAISVDAATNGVSEVKVTAVYINNIKTSSTGTPLLAVGDEVAKDWKSPTNYAVGSDYEKMYDSGLSDIGIDMAAGYHLFEQSTTETLEAEITGKMPHVILKVEVKDATGTLMPDKKFITIPKFTVGGAILTTIEAGKLYRINISSLSSLFKKTGAIITDPTDSYPEAGKVDINCTVEVKAWDIVDVTPNV